MNKNNRARIEAIVWGVVIVAEILWFLTYFRFGEWFKAVLPAVILSIAAILIRITICVLRYKNVPFPWERTSVRN